MATPQYLGMYNAAADFGIYNLKSGASIMDNSSNLNQIISSMIPSDGAVLYVPTGAYYFTAPVTVPNSVSGLQLRGVSSGFTTGLSPLTTFLFTGTGSFLFVNGSTGFRLEDLGIISTSFTGNLIDLQGPNTPIVTATTNASIDRCLIGGIGSGRAIPATGTSLIALNRASGCSIRNSLLAGGDVGIAGWSGNSGDFSYGNQITGCSFINNLTSHIWNGGNSWLVMSNTFESLFPSGEGQPAGAFAYGIPVNNTFNPRQPLVKSNGMAWIGNWHGDASEGTTWVDAAGSGWIVQGNYFALGDALKPISAISFAFPNNTGIIITGNAFDCTSGQQGSHGIDFNANAGNTGWWGNNAYVPTLNAMFDPPPSNGYNLISVYDTTLTLDTNTANNRILQFWQATTSPYVVTLPNTDGALWTIVNAVTATLNITAQGSSSPIAIPANVGTGKPTIIVYSDGQNLVQVTTPTYA